MQTTQTTTQAAATKSLALIAPEGGSKIDSLTGAPISSLQFKTDEHSTLDGQTFPFFTPSTLGLMKGAQDEADYFNYGDKFKPATSEDFKNNKQWVNKYHFDNGRIADSADAIRGYYADIVQWSNPQPTRGMKREAGKNLGFTAHALQDFYAHANWVESMVEGVIAPGVLLNAGKGEFPTLKPGSNASGLMVMDSIRPGATTEFGTIVDYALGTKGSQKAERPGIEKGAIRTVTVYPYGRNVDKEGYDDTDMTVVVQAKDQSGTSKQAYGLITSTLDPSYYGLNGNGSTLDPKISISHGYGFGTSPFGGVVDLPQLYDPQAKSSGLAKDAVPDPNNNNQTGFTTAWSGYIKMQNIAKFLASEQMLNELSRAYALIKAKWGTTGADRFSQLWLDQTYNQTKSIECPIYTPDQSKGFYINLLARQLNPLGASYPRSIKGWDIIEQSGNVRTLNVVEASDTIIKVKSEKFKDGSREETEERAAKLIELRDGDEVVATAIIPVADSYRVKKIPRSGSPSYENRPEDGFSLLPSTQNNLKLDANPNKPGFQASFNMRIESDPSQMLGFTREDLTYNGTFYGLRNVDFIVN